MMYTMETMTTRYVEVDGIRMRWEEAGDGFPVVFVHGIPTDPSLWRDVIPHVEGARSLAWEMVGYGASVDAGREHDISVAKQAEYLVAWMRSLGLEQAILVGHDLGGGVVQIAAARHPELIAGLVLMNAIAYDSWPIPMIRALAALGGLVERLPLPVFRLVIWSTIAMGHTDRVVAKASFLRHWQQYNRSDGPDVFVRQVRSLNVHDTLAIADALPRLNVPTHLVWGTADRFQKIGYGYRLAYDLRGTLDRIEGGKHFVPEDFPERVAMAVNEMLRQEAQNAPPPVMQGSRG